MSRVIFTIEYEVKPEKRDEYLTIAKELKNIVKAEGLDEYTIFENCKKTNVFEEKYFFVDEQAYEEFDDIEDERIDILTNKLSDMIKETTTKYSVMKEVFEI
ncbi:MAG: hypothetical protein ACEPO8_05455 [Rhodothermaceae bacterium]